MKYLPTIDLWSSGIQEAILNDQLKMQMGQWVRCGRQGAKSIYVSNTKFSIHCVHGANEKQVLKRFKEVVKFSFKAEQRRKAILVKRSLKNV